MSYDIIFEDDFLIAVNKPSGLPVQSDKTGDSDLSKMLEEKMGQELFMVNRVDRPASGLVLFAKNKTIANKLTSLLSSRKMEKIYLAVVGKKPEKPAGKLIHYLRKDGKSNRSFAFDKPLHHTKEAALEYEWLSSSERYHLLKILLITGRHHQIRAQLSAIGLPVKGDVKYGFRRGNRDRSIHLHAWKLSFRHPVSKELLSFEAPAPQDVVWENIF